MDKLFKIKSSYFLESSTTSLLSCCCVAQCIVPNITHQKLLVSLRPAEVFKIPRGRTKLPIVFRAEKQISHNEPLSY